MASWFGGLSLSMAGLGVIHGIAGELGAIKDYHHGEVCGRLLLPFLDLLESSDHPQQRALMAELDRALFGAAHSEPARYLAQWLQEQAIFPFWREPQPLSAEEVSWIVTRANSKNALVDYSETQMREMLAQAYRCAV